MTRSDAALTVAILVACVLSIPALTTFGSGGSAVLITGPAGETVLPQDARGTFRVEGRLGEMVFAAGPDGVRCIESPCSDGVCMRSGSAGNGRPVVCAPNGVIAMVSSRAGSEMRAGLDAVSR